MRMVKVVALLSSVCISATAIAQVPAHAAPHVIVYKAKASYKDLVPVTLSDDGKLVVSYPDPMDLRTGSGYPLPVQLHKGYWLDNRGIGKHTAFLSMTYQQYAHLKKVPTPAALLRMIKDKKPIVAIYDCGNRYTQPDIVPALNKLIDDGMIGTGCTIIN